MNKLHWFPFYYRDFFDDETVKLMSHAQVGMYIKLLAHQWHEGSIPTNIAAVMKLLGVEAVLYSDDMGDGEARIQSMKDVMTHFQTVSKGRAVNQRLAQIKDEQVAEMEKNKARTASATEARVARQRNDERNDQRQHNVTCPKSESESKTELKKKKKEKCQPADWLPALRADPLFAGINFDEELRKIAIWKLKPKNARRQITKTFLLNWLSTVDVPLLNSNGQSQPPPPPPKTDPIGRGQWAKIYGDPKDYGY